LEDGTGFHPDLTGRENIDMNGAILGMRIAEIDASFDAIVEFAEIGQFIDTPVKRYSSGMYVRLAFAVAAHLRPEILLVDEVLAVGDAAFQKKCLGKIDDVAREGRTILFVSHNMAAVQGLCGEVLWLDSGRVRDQGPASAVIGAYLREQMVAGVDRVWKDVESAPGNEIVRLHRARLVPRDGTPPDEITVRTPLDVEFYYWTLQPDIVLNLSVQVKNEEGGVVFSTPSTVDPVWRGCPFAVGLYRSTYSIPGDLLNDNTYRLRLIFVRDLGTVLHVEDDVLTFEVGEHLDARGDWFGKWAGVVRPQVTWTTEFLEPVCMTTPTGVDSAERGVG
jgi:lipopolysaccharide transport system ATP-binding protein